MSERRAMIRFGTGGQKMVAACAACGLLLAGASSGGARQNGAGAASVDTTSGGSAVAAAKTAASSDPILAAMAAELDRSKAQIKMDNVSAPYYIEYHVADQQEFYAEAAFGALRLNETNHSRSLRVVVRVGNYKQDSYGPGGGQGVADAAPIDNDPAALRRALWLATDRAYKAAAQALANKQASQSQFSEGQSFDDFAHAQPLQSVEPVAGLNVDPKPWTDMLVKATSLFRNDPKLNSFNAVANFRVVNKYFVNSEGTVTRQGSEVDSLTLSAATQADDGMELGRSPYFVAAKTSDLPSAERFQAAAAEMVATLKGLREAPVTEEDYLGPVLFAPDASVDVVSALIGNNVIGDRPRVGDSARTSGSFAASYKSRVLPNFISAVDDPTVSTFQDKDLVGSYQVDDEGVRAQKVTLIQNGQLTNYLLGRQPIRDFRDSNGHGRAAAAAVPRPSIANLIVTSSEAISPADLKKKLLDMCRDQGKPYGYMAVALSVSQGGPGRGRGGFGPLTTTIDPVLLYRVYVNDGHQELVRGAEFSDLDTRSMRGDLIAAGNDPLVDNRPGAIPTTVVSPSLLFDELEIRRANEKNAKLPEYPAPELSSSAQH